MSLSLAIAIVVLADLSLIGLLAFVMSRAKLLAPHVSLATATASLQSSAPAIAPQASRSANAYRAALVQAA